MRLTARRSTLRKLLVESARRNSKRRCSAHLACQSVSLRFVVFLLRVFVSFKVVLIPGRCAMANKDQNKGKTKGNAPKLSMKEKKEKKAKKEAAKRASQ